MAGVAAQVDISPMQQDNAPRQGQPQAATFGSTRIFTSVKIFKNTLLLRQGDARSTISYFDEQCAAIFADAHFHSIGGRAELERIVEQCLLAGVVFRFRDYVSIKDLSKVSSIDPHEVAEVQRLFARCCDLTDAHDHASARNVGLPTPDEIHTDWLATHALVKAIGIRQTASKAC